MNILEKTKNSIRQFAQDARPIIYWSYVGDLSMNWGDKLNNYLAEKITGIKPIHRPDIYPVFGQTVHYWIGSHLSKACNNPHAEVWGSGFISKDAKATGRPRAIHAVRGKYSQEKLRHDGLEPPTVIGDPALLLPRFYRPKRIGCQYKLGVIPHIHEQAEPFFKKAETWEDTAIIDITGGIEEVVDQIIACELIASSSLHGLICANAYGVPSLWIEASNKVKGDGFKFFDYFSSVNREEKSAMRVDSSTERSVLLGAFESETIRFNDSGLIESCPLWR